MRLSSVINTTARACLGLGLALAIFTTTHAEAEISREARIQAALILRMIKFVEWPAEVMLRSNFLQICTWGDSQTEQALQNLQGQKVRERDIKVRKLSVPLNTRGCHVLYVSDHNSDVTFSALYDSGSQHLLTISGMPDFKKHGGMVTLIKQGNRIAFEIQLRHAREHGLQIGAPLLELARVVE